MKCEKCKQRKGILKFAQDMLAFTHGFTEMICRQCYIEILEKNKKQINKTLKKERKLLKNDNSK